MTATARPMRGPLLAATLALCLGVQTALSGCATPAAVTTPGAAIPITSPSALSEAGTIFTEACAAGGGVVQTLAPAAVSPDPTVQAAYAAIRQMCADGVPSSLLAAGFDAVSVAIAVAPYIHFSGFKYTRTKRGFVVHRVA